MKIKFLPLLIFQIIVYGLNAQTQVSGTISENTNWTKANSPYIIISNILVKPNVDLIIESGVTIKIAPNSGMVLRGNLKALGSLNDTIRFIPNNDIEWKGITADKNFNPKIELTYVKAEKAVIFLDIINNSLTSDTILKISNSWFNSNDWAIISEDRQNHIAKVTNSKFTNNTYYDFLYTGNSVITNSLFVGTKRSLYNSDLTSTKVDKCNFSGYDRAIAINGIVRNSEFYNNGTAIITMNNGSPELRQNYIHDNERGIETWTYQSNNPQEQIKFNKICNNGYNIFQIYSGDSYLTDNCWCTNDEKEIADKIYDIFDNTSLGLVSYQPIDSICSNLTSTENIPNEKSQSNGISIYPNPTNSYLYVELLNTNLSEMYLVDALGRSFDCQYVIKNDRIIIDVNPLYPGWYVLRLKTRDRWLSKTFIRSKN